MTGWQRTFAPACCRWRCRTGADVVIGKVHFLREEPVMTRWEEAVEKNFTFHTVYTGKEYLLKCLQTGGLRVEVGRHLYRTGFLRANGLQFARASCTRTKSSRRGCCCRRSGWC